MERNLGALDRQFDVLVVGGGIYGACVARLAAAQGLSVALLERGDFGGAVSHNSLKTVHGGFRYIQHFDLPRIWESVAAQRAWLHAAPHLVKPMRFVIPAYGHGTRGPLVFAAGIAAYQVAALRRNAGLKGRSRLPMPGLLSRRALIGQYPALARADLTGGAYWYDAQMLDANRLGLECLQDACDHGAVVANHIEVLQLRSTGAAVDGVVARDRISGRELEVRAAVTVNATGSSVERLLRAGPRPMTVGKPLVWTRNVNIVVPRVFDGDSAVGVGSRQASDAKLGASKRLFFVAPWQDCSIIGTSHIRHQGDLDDIGSDVDRDVAAFLDEVGEALPASRISHADVRYVHSGLTPAEDDTVRAKRGTIIDHERADGVRGLITVLGIKYTTAPTVAAGVMPIVRRLLDRQYHVHRISAFSRPLPGSVGFSSTGAREEPDASDRVWAERIYGARAPQMLAMLPAAGLSADEHVFRCRVLYGIRNEMVVRLRDAIFRASDLAERGALTAAQLEWCAAEMAAAYGWSAQRRRAEIEEVVSKVRLQPRADQAA